MGEGQGVPRHFIESGGYHPRPALSSDGAAQLLRARGKSGGVWGLAWPMSPSHLHLPCGLAKRSRCVQGGSECKANSEPSRRASASSAAASLRL